MKHKIILLLIVLFLMQSAAVINWSFCRGFEDQMRYSSFDLELRLIEGIHNDTGVPLQIVRAFHNKVVGASFDIYRAYLQYWRVTFLTDFISLAGVVGLVAGFYAFVTRKKSVMLWLLFWALLTVPFVEIFLSSKFPLIVRIFILAVPLVAWSMFGYRYLLQEKKMPVMWVIILLLVSLWYHISFFVLGKFCI